ncbi:hypothetical protein R6Q57_021333 [Mikania cordata]
MSYAAYKLMHPPTGIDNCAAGFITHSPADFAPRLLSVQTEYIDSAWSATTTPGVGPIPNLIVTAANVLEVYTVRVLDDGSNANKDSVTVAQPQRGGLMSGLSGASLELVCSYRGNDRRHQHSNSMDDATIAEWMLELNENWIELAPQFVDNDDWNELDDAQLDDWTRLVEGWSWLAQAIINQNKLLKP